MSEDTGPKNVVSLVDILRKNPDYQPKSVSEFIGIKSQTEAVNTATRCILLVEDDLGNGMFYRFGVRDSDLLWYSEVLRFKATEDWR